MHSHHLAITAQPITSIPAMVQVVSGLQHIGVEEFHLQEVGVPDVLGGVLSGSGLADHCRKLFCR